MIKERTSVFRKAGEPPLGRGVSAEFDFVSLVPNMFSDTWSALWTICQDRWPHGPDSRSLPLHPTDAINEQRT